MILEIRRKEDLKALRKANYILFTAMSFFKPNVQTEREFICSQIGTVGEFGGFRRNQTRFHPKRASIFLYSRDGTITVFLISRPLSPYIKNINENKSVTVTMGQSYTRDEQREYLSQCIKEFESKIPSKVFPVHVNFISFYSDGGRKEKLKILDLFAQSDLKFIIYQ